MVENEFNSLYASLYKNAEPHIAIINAIFARLEETAACANLTKEERELYEEQWRNYNDYYNTIDFAREEGREEGIVQVANTMKSQGFEVSLIAQCTGLSPEEIEKL